MSKRQKTAAKEMKPVASRTSLHEDIGQLYGAKDFADFVLISKDGKEFPVHRAILSARSKVFAAMFRMSKSKENQTGRCEIGFVESEILEVFLKFIYGVFASDSDIAVDPLKLMIAADEYDFQALVELCVKSMEKLLNGGNAGEILVVADQYNLATLKAAALQHVGKNIREFLRSSQLEAVREHSVELMEEVLACIPDTKEPPYRGCLLHYPLGSMAMPDYINGFNAAVNHWAAVAVEEFHNAPAAPVVAPEL